MNSVDIVMEQVKKIIMEKPNNGPIYKWLKEQGSVSSVLCKELKEKFNTDNNNAYLCIRVFNKVRNNEEPKGVPMLQYNLAKLVLSGETSFFSDAENTRLTNVANIIVETVSAEYPFIKKDILQQRVYRLIPYIAKEAIKESEKTQLKTATSSPELILQGLNAIISCVYWSKSNLHDNGDLTFVLTTQSRTKMKIFAENDFTLNGVKQHRVVDFVQLEPRIDAKERTEWAVDYIRKNQEVADEVYRQYKKA